MEFSLNISLKKEKKRKTKNVEINKISNDNYKGETNKKDNFSPILMKSPNTKVKKQFKFSKERKTKKYDELNSQSSFTNLPNSSLFANNPDIPSLSVSKQEGLSEPLFSDKSFDSLDLHPHLVSCLKQRLKVETLTKVQLLTIPLLLNKNDVLIKSCTGSGKTLAYAVPIVQHLQSITPKIQRSDGVFALVILPTRELALQCYDCFSNLTKAFNWIVPGYLIGGEKKKSEKNRIRKGINILVITPGRLLDHLEHTVNLNLSNIKWLVIDEADKLLEEGFEKSVFHIMKACPQERQTVLLSATMSNDVENLAGITLSDPIHVDASKNKNESSAQFEEFTLPSKLKQYITVVPSKLRLAVLSAFIVDTCFKGFSKGLVFVCSTSSVSFLYSLLGSSLEEILKAKGHSCKFFQLHGNMKQEERTAVFNEFKSKEEGILFCTDVAARGLDLPLVDWIVQFSVPSSPEIYVHRVGRTARIGHTGRALLFLLPSENKFSNLLTKHKIVFEEKKVSTILQSLLLIGNFLSSQQKVSADDCATFLQLKYEKDVYAEEILHQSAKDAFRSYVHSYASYPKSMGQILPFKALHLGHVAKSFCLRETPSDLGASRSNNSQQTFKRKESMNKQQKRQYPVEVSEFDSGLSFLNTSSRKKRKH